MKSVPVMQVVVVVVVVPVVVAVVFVVVAASTMRCRLSRAFTNESGSLTSSFSTLSLLPINLSAYSVADEDEDEDEDEEDMEDAPGGKSLIIFDIIFSLCTAGTRFL
jgi:hypothetical protein